MQTIERQGVIPEKLDGRRLDQALAVMFPDFSRSRLKAWILAGQVSLDGASAAPRVRVNTGQRVAITATQAPSAAARPEPIELAVVYEDDDLLVIDKPAGLVVHPGAGNPAGTLMNGLLHRVPGLAELPRSGILHRLDKDTTGLLLVAKSEAAHAGLASDLHERRVEREYRGVCMGRLTAGGRIEAPVGRHPTNRTRMAVVADGRAAATNYRVLTRFAAHTLCAMRLESGRTHQIRVHFAHVRHALFGDPVYGGRLWVPAGASASFADTLRGFSRQALHASRIGFMHPVSGDAMHFRAPLPADFTGLLDALARDAGIAAPADWNDLEWPAAESG